MKVIAWSDYDTDFTDLDFIAWFENEFGELYYQSRDLDRLKKYLTKNKVTTSSIFRSQNRWYFVFADMVVDV